MTRRKVSASANKRREQQRLYEQAEKFDATKLKEAPLETPLEGEDEEDGCPNDPP